MQKEGRGLGQLREYKPWLTIRDVKTIGFSHRIKGYKTNRTHHMFSNLELSFFLWLEWLPNVVDIRERYPLLPISKTIQIAEFLNIKHRVDPSKNEPVVMTTDFLVNHIIDGEKVLKAYSVMSNNSLNSVGILRRLLIEREYWLQNGIDFQIVTEKEIPKEIVSNVDWCWTARNLEFLPIKNTEELLFIELFLSNTLNNSNQSLAKICIESDYQLGFKPGSCIQLVKHFISNRYWSVDMTKRITTANTLEFKRNEDQIAKLQKTGVMSS